MGKINFIKKYLSFLLIAVFLFSSVPLEILASSQKHVRNLTILSDKATNGYAVKLGWENPEDDADPEHKRKGFKIFERKANKSGENFNVIQTISDTKATEYLAKNRPLKDGSIYEYKVWPYHTHPTDKGDVDAPMDTLIKEETALFLTDIKVEAKGSGNTLTVTFDNPKYNDKNLFTGFKIYYEKGGSEVKEFNFSEVIDINNKDIIHSYDAARGVDRITYKITNDNIKQGNIYAVKVEPMFNGAEIRTKDNLNPSISIGNNISKKISFNPASFKEYRTNEVHVAVSLNILENGKDFLKLKWGDLSGITTVGKIEEVSIYSGETENTITNKVGSVYSQDAVKISSWQIQKPTKKTYYQIQIKIENLQKPIFSEIAFFDPIAVNITPNKPSIYTKVKIENDKSFLDIYWDTFTRVPYSKEEEALVDKNTNLYIDKDILYDVWVTDSNQNLNKSNLPKVLEKYDAKKLTQTNIKESKTPVYQHKINKYYTVDENGSFLEKEIEENKVYYIKIVAIKPTTSGVGLESQPAEYLTYVEARGDISKPNSLSKPPLRVKKDEEGKELIKPTSIPIEWNTKWFEVYDTESEAWYPELAVKDGELIFGKSITDKDEVVKFYNLISVEDVKNAIKEAGYADAENLLVRNIDISQSNIKYELIVKPFDEINIIGGYEQYIESILNSESEEWKQIQPKFSDNNKYAEYEVTDLKENTRYAVLLRPYRMLRNGRKDAYPTYILVTTPPKDTIVDITPVTPTLEEVSKTDVSIEVAWKDTSSGISYELAISEILEEDPGKAKRLIDSKDIKENATSYTSEQGEPYFKYDIKGLFPDTGYYIWIRATVDKTGKKSEWSNPIYVRTEKLKKPNPPNGLGLASQKNVTTYNEKNETDYKPVGAKYLIVEWLRDEEDKAEEAKAPSNEKGEGLIEPSIKKFYMAKFNKLLPNKDYYVRAKTKVYISKSKDGKNEKLYSYILQISRDKEFKEFFEIEIPEVKPSGDKVLTSESEWTEIFRFRTKKSDGEEGDYDGNMDDLVYPLPTEDFEIFYDGITQTLVYRFRSNKKDGNGNNDNLVDQRFITKLVNDKVYDYKIDLTNHLGYNIKNRRVELPFSIIKAFEERKISLSVLVSGTTFKLNAGFLNTPEVKAIGGLDNGTSVYIDILQSPSIAPILSYNQSFTSLPQQLNISISKNGIAKPISYLGSDMNLDIKLNSRTSFLDNNVSIYKKNGNLWQKMPSVYNSEKGSMALKTKDISTFSTIETATKFNDATGKLDAINRKILIKDLNNSNLSLPISVVQFNNIIAGVANGKNEIYINNALSTKDFNSLKKAGMLLEGAVVSREAGINILVKLYEMKTKSSFKPSFNINTTPFKDIRNANKTYQQNLIKAGEIGFFENINLARPKSNLTMEEMLYIIDIILEDSGIN